MRFTRNSNDWLTVSEHLIAVRRGLLLAADQRAYLSAHCTDIIAAVEAISLDAAEVRRDRDFKFDLQRARYFLAALRANTLKPADLGALVSTLDRIAVNVDRVASEMRARALVAAEK